MCMSSHSAPTMPNLVRKWLSVTSLKLQSYNLVYKNLWLDVTGLQSAVLMLHTVYRIERAD